MPIRVELSKLSRAADQANELSRAMSSIVMSDVPSPGVLAMQIDEWKREMQDWGYDMSPSARDHRLAGGARTDTARRKAFDAMLRAKR